MKIRILYLLFLFPLELLAQGSLVMDTVIGTAPTCYEFADGNAQVQVSGGSGTYTYSWSHAPFLNNDFAGSLTAGTYSVTVTDGTNTVVGSTTLFNPNKVLIGMTKLDVGCNTNNGSITLSSNYSSNPNLKYHWSNNSGFFGNFLENLGVGTYQVSASVGACKSDTLTINLNQLPATTIDVWDTLNILQGTSIVIYQTHTPGERIHLTWSPEDLVSCVNCDFPTVQPEETTIFYCTIYDSVARCTVYDSCIVKVLEPEYFADCPNTFSPNGDYRNDLFYVRGYGIKEIQLNIFDRNGGKVFFSEDIDKGWDGTLENKPLDSGVFVYSCSGKFVNDKDFFIKGTLTLIR